MGPPRRRLNWPGRNPRKRRAVWAAYAGAGLSALFVLFSIVSWAFGGGAGLFRADRVCAENPLACNALVEGLGTVAAVSIAFLFFANWRMHRIVGEYLHGADKKGWELIPTATEITEVVGRDGICEIIERDLIDHDDGRRRVQIVVAGVGDG
jgi:hypothetical protein